MDTVYPIKEIRDAIKRGNLEKVKELINSYDGILNVMTPFGTLLHIAATHGKIEIVKYLIECGFDINTKDTDFSAGAIVDAASNGHIEIAEYLLNNGADMDISESKRNPLFAAIYGGHKNIVELLVNKGIDIHVRYTSETMQDMDAYAFAIERGQSEIASYLKGLN